MRSNDLKKVMMPLLIAIYQFWHYFFSIILYLYLKNAFNCNRFY